MQIIINIFQGETFTVEVGISSDTVLNVKHQVQERLGFPPEQLRLILAGRKLQDAEKLSDYNVQNGTQFHLMYR